MLSNVLRIRRMPADSDPAPPRGSNHRIIYMQRKNGGASDWRQSHKQNARFIPFEMRRPEIAARVKQARRLAAQGVYCGDASAFEFVTATAGETKVVVNGLSTL